MPEPVIELGHNTRLIFDTPNGQMVVTVGWFSEIQSLVEDHHQRLSDIEDRLTRLEGIGGPIS